MDTKIPESSFDDIPNAITNSNDISSNDKYFPLSMHQFLDEAIRNANTKMLAEQLEKDNHFGNIKDIYPSMDYSFGQGSHEPIDTYFRTVYPSKKEYHSIFFE